jgi:hypothetical protein
MVMMVLGLSNGEGAARRDKSEVSGEAALITCFFNLCQAKCSVIV